MGRHAQRPGCGIDDKTRPGHGRIEPAVVPVVAVPQAERAVLPEGVVAQNPAVALAAVHIAPPRGRVQVTTIRGAAVVRRGRQPVDLASVVRLPALRVVEIPPGVVPQVVAVELTLVLPFWHLPGEGNEIDVPAIEKPPVETTGVQSRGMAGVARLPAGVVPEIALRVVAHHHAVAVGREVEVPAVEHRADIALHAQRPGVVHAPALQGSEIAFGVVLQHQARTERREIDVPAVEGPAVETRGPFRKRRRVEDLVARRILEPRPGVEAQDLAAGLGIVERHVRRLGVPRAAVEVPAVEGHPLPRVGQARIVRLPASAALEVSMGVVAQKPAVVHRAVVAGIEVHVPAVESPTVEPGRVQPVNVTRVVRLVARRIAEVSVSIVPQHAAVHRLSFTAGARGTAVHVLTVEHRPEVPPGCQSIGVAGVVGAEGVEGGQGLPLRDQGLHGLGPVNVAVDPGLHRNGGADIHAFPMRQLDIGIDCMAQVLDHFVMRVPHPFLVRRGPGNRTAVTQVELGVLATGQSRKPNPGLQGAALGIPGHDFAFQPGLALRQGAPDFSLV